MFTKTIRFIFISLIITTASLQSSTTLAKTKRVNFDIAYTTVNFTGTPMRAIAINGQVPGPTLHFKEGDDVSIVVHNHLPEGTSVHWHGLILPWRMDGVAYVTQWPTPPGKSYNYHYKLKQYGTYWYHSHYYLQEQAGMYGAYIIDPRHQRLHYNKDFAITLGDWINTLPTRVYWNLKKSGDYYSVNFPLQPSLLHFIRSYRHANPAEKKHILKAYKTMQFSRMSPYDLSDVAYDAFLINGHSNRNPWTGLVKVGDIVRLRFIGSGASTFFNIKIPGEKLKVVNVDGNDVRPYLTDKLNIGPGETFDILLKIKRKKPYLIYAESIDTVGAAHGALLTSRKQHPDFEHIKPFPEPRPRIMTMPPGSMQIQTAQKQLKENWRPKRHFKTSANTKYAKVRALTPTNNPKRKPDHVIKMVLTGYMGRYIWFINGLTEYQTKPIPIKKGDVYRLIFVNRTLMNHPMHIHGHWFILRNGHGAYDPKMHTLAVDHGQTIVADFKANTSGQWYFHCHNLYHMVAGMARIWRYEDSPVIFDVKRDVNGVMKKEQLKGEGDQWFSATMLDLNGDFWNSSYEGTFKSLMGTDYNKLELLSKEAEMSNGQVTNFDLDIFYYRVVSQFWAVKGGINYFNQPSNKPYWQPGVGVEGLMPFFISTDIRVYYHSSSVKFDLDFARATQLTNNLYLVLGIRTILATKTVTADQVGSGLNYIQYTVQPTYNVIPGLAVYFQYQRTHNYGDFARIQTRVQGSPAISNAYSLGFTWLF